MKYQSPKHERTVIIIKPDAIQRRLIADIIGRFERKGLKIVGLKMMSLDDVLLKEHYNHHLDKPFFDDMARFMKSSPVVVMALEGLEAVKSVRTLVGATSGREADVGTIRGDLSMSTGRNIAHASDSVEMAKAELKRFFKPEELHDYHRSDHEHIYSEEER